MTKNIYIFLFEENRLKKKVGENEIKLSLSFYLFLYIIQKQILDFILFYFSNL